MAILYLSRLFSDETEAYYQSVIVLTGMTGIMAMLISLFFYRRDEAGRRLGGIIPGNRAKGLDVGEGIWLLFMGAAFSQFANILMNILQIFLQSTEYQESMSRITEGKSLLMLVFWMGIIAPAAEEVVFRWLIYLRLRDYLRMGRAIVISGLIFGIYHGNLLQFIYASILGMIFAYVLEMTGSLYSCVLLHMGANIWSLVYPEIGMKLLETPFVYMLFVLMGALFAVMITGIRHFINKGKQRGTRCV